MGDALHALSCAAGYNIRWLMQAIVRLGLGRLFCALSAVPLWGLSMRMALLFNPSVQRTRGRPQGMAGNGSARMLMVVAG